MAVEKKRMKQLRGAWSNFDKSIMLSGEFAVITSGGPNSHDGRELYIAFNAGYVKQLMTYEDAEFMIDGKTEEIVETLTQDVGLAVKQAIDAAEFSNNAGISAIENSQKAETAANLVIVAINDLDARRLAGEFNGPQGPQGIPGRDGANGVVTTMQGQYAFQIVNGHLHLIYVDGTEPPNYEIVENGHLILTIPAT